MAVEDFTDDIECILENLGVGCIEHNTLLLSPFVDFFDCCDCNDGVLEAARECVDFELITLSFEVLLLSSLRNKGGRC